MTNCIDNSEEHNFGLWSINPENQSCACRTCEKCGFTRTLPLTKEIEQEIRRQKEANIYFKAFTLAKNDDSKILGYLNIIFDDCLNYLSQDDLNTLKEKLASLEISEKERLEEENINYLKAFSTYLAYNDREKIDEVLEQFQIFNAKNFSTILNRPLLDEIDTPERKPR